MIMTNEIEKKIYPISKTKNYVNEYFYMFFILGWPVWYSWVQKYPVDKVGYNLDPSIHLDTYIPLSRDDIERYSYTYTFPYICDQIFLLCKGLCSKILYTQAHIPTDQ